MKNKKGFTLVETIATITILGVLALIVVVSVSFISNKIRENYYEKQRGLILLSGKDYFSDRRDQLPTTIADGVKFVTLYDLVNLKYMDPVKDYKGVSCVNEDSKVFVRKKSNGEYQYDVYWTCSNESLGGDTYLDDKDPNPPDIELENDYGVTILERGDNGDPASGICATYYTINNEDFTEDTRIRYTGKFYVTNQEGKITIRAISYDCAGKVSSEAEPKTFYINPMYCDASLEDNCQSNNFYNSSCRGAYDQKTQSCVYSYHSNVSRVPDCQKGEASYGATECSVSKEARCSSGTLSGGSCVNNTLVSTEVSGIACCYCKDKKWVTSSGNTKCKPTHFRDTAARGGCPLGSYRLGNETDKYDGTTYEKACTAKGECTEKDLKAGNWKEVSVTGLCESYTEVTHTTPDYVCPSGYTVNENETCVRTAELKTTYTCQKGDARSGSLCMKITSACNSDEFYHKGKCYGKKGR